MKQTYTTIWITQVFLQIIVPFDERPLSVVNAFTSLHQIQSQVNLPRQSISILSMSNFLNDIGKFFDGLGRNDKEPAGQGKSDDDGGERESSGDHIYHEEEGFYTGSTRIITIPGEFSETLLFPLG